MNKVPGFTLLELLLGTAISSLLLTILFIALNQINRTKKNLDNQISKTGRISLLRYQLEHDLMGAFVPITPAPSPAPVEKKEEAKPKPGEQKKPEAPKPEEKKEPEKTKANIDKLFFSENQGANLATLTFISNNPMPVYWSKKAGRAQPKVVRIVYRLKQDPVHPNAFILLRQEGDDLDFKAYDLRVSSEKQKYRPYELIEGIKNILVVYYYLPVKKQTAANPQEKKQEEKQEYRTAKEWGKKKEGQEKSDIPPLPHFAEVTLVLWDNARQRDSIWKFTVPLVPTSLPAPPKPPASPAAPKPGSATPSNTNKSEVPGLSKSSGSPNTSKNSTSSSPFSSNTRFTPSGFQFPEIHAGVQPGVHIGPRTTPGVSGSLRSSSLSRYNNLIPQDHS